MATVRTNLIEADSSIGEMRRISDRLFGLYRARHPETSLAEARKLRASALRVVEIGEDLIRRFEYQLDRKKPTDRS